MKGDFSRLTFRADNHYSSVRMQQGRVHLDADWNEQVDIQAHYDHTTTQDTIGDSGAPIHEAGFGIVDLQPTTSADSPPNFSLGAGHYYVDGILCEIEQKTLLTAQPDLPGITTPQELTVDLRTDSSIVSSTYLVYLDVWQRNLTVLEKPDLREVALGGVDTTTRTQTVWQVKLARVDNGTTCSSFGNDWIPTTAVSTGQLRAQDTPPTEVTADLCKVPAGGGYRRLENQLYRVETHLSSSDTGGPTFKWSRDNASMVAKLENIVGSAITVSDAGRDEVLGFVGSGWVELTDEERLLQGRPGFLVELESIQGNTFNIKDWNNPTPLTMANFVSNPTVRRWDGTLSLTSGMQNLEAGVQVELETTGIYRTGDYWLIPARSLIGKVLWQHDSSGHPVFEPHQGIQQHYAALGLLQFDGTNWSISDCRKLFPPLTEMIRFFYVSGDGQEAMPGNLLPRPLQVGVVNGQTPVTGARIQFRVSGGSGTLSPTPSGVFAVEQIVTTNNEGIAECYWNIGSDSGDGGGEGYGYGSEMQPPQVEARLLAPDNSPVQVPIRFNANFSVARQVYYDASNCPDLSLVGVSTVQAAIDQLCRRTGGGCAVTVGKSGQYLTINDAINDLYSNQGQTSLCLCLLPGQHELFQGLELNDSNVHFKISGCGTGTQVSVFNRPITLQNLASITFKDLAITIPNDLRQTALLCDSCSEVTITGCHLSSVISPDLNSAAPWSALLQIGGSDRIYLENNVFRAYVAASLERPAQLFANYLQFQVFDENVFERQASELSKRLVEDSSLREQLREAVNAALGNDSRDRRIYEEFIEFIGSQRVRSNQILQRFRKIREIEIRTLAGIAIIINDANAETTILDNQIMGVVSLYGYSDGYGYGYNYDMGSATGYTDLDENEFSRFVDNPSVLSRLLSEERLRLFGPTSTLQMRGNRLTRFTIAEEMFRVIKDFLKDLRSGSGYGDEDRILDLEDVYQFMFFTNNLIDDTKNQWIAQHLILSTNAFDTIPQNSGDVGTVIGKTAVVTSNRGFDSDSVLPVIAGNYEINNNLAVTVFNPRQ